jgi:hypothetical protein
MERNAALVRRVIDEVWNAGDCNLADAVFALPPQAVPGSARTLRGTSR